MSYKKYRAHFKTKSVQPDGKVKLRYLGSLEFFGDTKNDSLISLAFRRANREQQDAQIIRIEEI